MEGELDFGISIVENDVMKPVSDSSTLYVDNDGLTMSDVRLLLTTVLDVRST